jgi:hypothetical protein
LTKTPTKAHKSVANQYNNSAAQSAEAIYVDAGVASTAGAKEMYELPEQPKSKARKGKFWELPVSCSRWETLLHVLQFGELILLERSLGAV